MNDYMIRGTAAGGEIRVFAAYTKATVEEARERHGLSPVATAALGRLMTGALMMGSMMKNDSDVLTLQIHADGPINGLTVTANARGEVKGYVGNPEVMLPPKNGKLDVGGAVGIGLLSVVKDLGLKEPYSGQTILVSSEIGDDLTYYFANSEQVPSSVGLGVLMNKDNTVRHAGGFIIQLMPFASEETISTLEANIGKMNSVTQYLDEGMTPVELAQQVLGELELVVQGEMPVKFYCDCNKEKVAAAVASIAREDIEEMIADDEDIEVKCHFCNTAYTYTPEDLQGILDYSDKEA
ncbi:Hsp33 family molecular chaperone HslO [Ohessyouella blattaphilus]|uniref:33 kDa chaperonin n=1 Tax=Ohessyouella blattaphilus TaxID=2949333 RepID=A0ABT1ELG6_9FIRM|nr:Hsp33 family molecular chaperone HslO [Ohessyouella blattaphilus]MCP1110117.1 Hsp33 family molecular chaperone HslO [Ohessyouella blattaphilus]MCR8563511.1 Hsp33 family molecular chaperone HslO [Ohessyouella blattaphilus]